MIRWSGPFGAARGLARATVLILLAGGAPGLAAQARAEDVRAEVFVGSEAERYLRVLQVAGAAPVVPWTVRGFGPREVARMAPDTVGHPWAGRYDYSGERASRVWAVGPGAAVRANSGFPMGAGDGPVWAGRGLTFSATAGAAVSAGPLTLVVAPLAFVAANRGFALAPVDERFSPYADPEAPGSIDLPQRFGTEPYARVDPGESTLRVDAGPLAAALSTASQGWGPAQEQPLVLGNNAGGFPHLAVGTSGPAAAGVGRVSARVVWGVLAQSAYSPASGRASRRFMSGWVAAISPAGLPGLELGMTRFYHTPWPEGGVRLRHFAKPFEELFKADIDPTGIGTDSVSDRDNQLASVFLRWVLPRARAEVYGEYAREDHSWDLLDFFLEPDHSAAYTLGFQKAWTRSDGRMVVLRGEVLNARRSHLLEVRRQPRFYQHASTRQGHTLRGQVLGAPDARGGAAAMLALDAYAPGGRWTVRWSRAQRRERDSDGDVAGAADAYTTLGAERLWFLPFAEVTASLTGAWEVNRDFGDDAFNLNAQFALRARL